MFKILKNAWRVRDIIWRLALTDIKMKYVGSYLGVVWSLLEPLLIILIYSFVFPSILNVSFTEWFPFFICGLIPYRYFRNGVLSMTTSLVDFSDILRKSKLDPKIVFISKGVSTFVSFLIEISIVLVFVLVFFGVSYSMLLLPLIIFFHFIFNTGLALFLAVNYPKFRDINYIFQIISEALMFLTPIVYRIQHIPVKFRKIYVANPLVKLIYLYQWSLLYFPSLSKYFPLSPFNELLIFGAISTVLFLTGYKYFEKKVKKSLEVL